MMFNSMFDELQEVKFFNEITNFKGIPENWDPGT